MLAAEADVQHHHEEVLAAEAADVQRRHESAARAAESDAVIERIWTEFALCAAPLNVILAEIACEEAAFKTKLSSAVLHHMWTQSCSIWGGHTTVFAPCCLAFGTRACGSTIA